MRSCVFFVCCRSMLLLFALFVVLVFVCVSVVFSISNLKSPIGYHTITNTLMSNDDE